jgi:hypothetical protein
MRESCMCVCARAAFVTVSLTRSGRRGFGGDPHLAVITRDPIFFRARSSRVLLLLGPAPSSVCSLFCPIPRPLSRHFTDVYDSDCHSTLRIFPRSLAGETLDESVKWMDANPRVNDSAFSFWTLRFNTTAKQAGGKKNHRT